MRYFRYSNNRNKLYKQALKEHYKSLGKEERVIFRKKRAWTNLGTIIACIAFFACVVGLSFCWSSFLPIYQPQFWLLKILFWIGVVEAAILLLIIPCVVTALAANPILKMAESFEVPSMKSEISPRACAFLRKYYGLNEPCIITKCYEADDANRSFTKKDVCLFVVNGELRITKDIVHGFLNGDKDLGCYAFSSDEIKLVKQQKDGLLMVRLDAPDGVSFTLGYRAKAFIEKNFILKV